MKVLFFIIISVFSVNSTLYAQLFDIPDPDIAVDYSIVENEKNSFLEIAAVYVFPEGFHQTHNPEFFKVSVSDKENNNYSGVFKVLYPEGKTEDGVINYYDSAVIKLMADLSSFPPGDHVFDVEASYQLCDEEGVCYFPGSEIFPLPVSIPAAPGGGIINLLKYLLLAAAGGLLLNIMPCVFPLLSIKALTLIRQGSEDRKKIFLSSTVYSAGIIFSLFILALIVIILRKAGSFAGWGFQMQSPWFVITMISVIYVFALSMFDVFIITLPGQSAAGKAASIKGYSGHFLTGIFAVIVAAPCTAPFLGSAVAFAFYQNSLMIMLIFIFIGLGFSTPFLILGLYPGIIKKIPHGGSFSIVFKELLGFVLAGTALYFLYAYSIGKNADAVIRLIIFLFILTFAAWFYGKTAYPGAGLKRTIPVVIFLLLLIAGSADILLRRNHDTSQSAAAAGTAGTAGENETENEKEFSNTLLDSLLQENIPVFVNIYADWCTTCKINEKFVLGTEEIRDFFSSKGIITLKGDFTGNDPEIAAWMRANKKAGVPVYAYYSPSNNGNEPVFFPEILRKDSLIENILIYSQK